MTLHNFGAHSSQVNGAATYVALQRSAKSGWKSDEAVQSRGPAEAYNDKPRSGPPSGNSTDGETFGIRALGKWQRSHKGLDPASAAILGYLIGVATKGVATVKQSTIASQTGLSVWTVGRRLDLLEHVGLISREKRAGKHMHRLCDAISLMLDCQPLKLSGARSKELVRQFNCTARTRGDAKNQGADGETNRKICRDDAQPFTDGPSVNFQELLSHDVSCFPPVQVSSATPQSPDAVSAERGSDAPATPSISLTGDQRTSSEESRPSTDQGSAPATRPDPADDSDIDAADEVYRDEAPWDGDRDGEFASLPQADSACHEPPVSRPSPARASTPATTPHALAARPVKAKRPNDRAVCWKVLLPEMQALHKQNFGGYMTQVAARGRMGRIINQIGLNETAILMRAVLKVGPAGNPFDYAAKMMLGEAISLATATDSLQQPIRYI